MRLPVHIVGTLSRPAPPRLHRPLTLPLVAPSPVCPLSLTQLFNYLHSFGGDVKLTPDTPIPLSVFQRWYDNFNRKISNDSGAAFLDRED